jgi:2-succinyl-6-hydroxy-2,4-cyclohexadiene-1-carboxylate synthase
VVTVDLPGHGRSAGVAARDLAEAGELVAEAGGGGTYVGYSMGGRVSLHAAFVRPELVRRLVLVGAHPGIADAAELERRRRDDEALATRLAPAGGGGPTLEAFLAEWLAAPLFAHLDEATANVAARRENTTAGLAGALRTLGTGTQRYDPARLRALAMPVLVVAGSLDSAYTSIGQDLAATIGANATFAPLPGVGHAAPFEAPGPFAALVETWLALPGSP